MTLWARIGLIATCASCASAAGRGDGGASGDAGLSQDGGGDGGSVVDAGPSYSVQGQVAHLDGTPWSNAIVGFCSSVACLNPILSTETGTFDEDELVPDEYVVDVTGDNSDGGSASPVYFHFQLQSNLTLTSPIVVPETGPGVIILDGGVQTVQIDNSLSVTLDPSALTWPDGEGDSISGIEIPARDWPASYASDLLDGGNQSILAVWALNPFQLASSTPIAVVIRNNFELSPGSHAQLFGIDVTSGMPQDLVELEVADDGGVLTTLPGQGITELTWLLLVSDN
jgi:hypothetical protein